MDRLAAAGHEVVGVCRSGHSEAPDGVRIEAGDVSDPPTSRRLAEGAAVVYGCIGMPYPDWMVGWLPVVDGLVGAAETSGARLVFADNLYCYGPQQRPLAEETPLTRYGRKPALRAAMARIMLEAHRVGRAQVALARASDFYGPRVTNSALGERVFAKILAGKAAQVLGDPDQPHAYTYVGDFADALVLLGEAEDADYGQAWHVPNAPTESTRQIVQRVGRLVGIDEPRTQTMPKLMLNVVALFSPLMRELKEMMYQWEHPYQVDHSKFAARFRFEPTSFDEGLEATLEWYRERES
jgi:nucleoside-diphosphate-sugar epimerase